MAVEAKFLSEIVNFLKEVEWLYDFPVTQVLTRDVLVHIPADWCEAFTDISLDILNGIPDCKYEKGWPSSLVDFMQQCRRLSLQQWVSSSNCSLSDYSVIDVELPKELCKGMSTKKRHEVTSMVKCIRQLSKVTNSSHVLDIGSGMGYVDVALHYTTQAVVFGAESEEFRVKNAQSRQAGLMGSCEGIQHINWTLNDDQSTLDKAKHVVNKLIECNVSCTCGVKSLVTESDDGAKGYPHFSVDRGKETDAFMKENGSNSVMLIGLHSCADLSPVMMKIFIHCPEISSLLLFSCCYHKLETEDISDVAHQKESASNSTQSYENAFKEKVSILSSKLSSNDETSDTAAIEVQKKVDKEGKNSFRNFPLSQTLKSIMNESSFMLGTYGLRLAAQESGVRWLDHSKEDHERHKRNVAYRALLEVFCCEEHLTLRKRRRRCARKSKFCDFSDYVNTVIETYEFIPMNEPKQTSDCESSGISERISISVQKNGIDDSELLNSGESLHSLNEKRLSSEYIKEGMSKAYAKYEHLFSIIEPFTGLQLALQPVLEALVLLDRLVYLKEAKFDKVWIEEVFDVALSPRNVALIAVRT